jgi:hypothetical protein
LEGIGVDDDDDDDDDDHHHHNHHLANMKLGHFLPIGISHV